jgi:hypothetical protein
MVWGRMPGSSANWGRMNGFECEQRTTTVGWLQEEDTSRHGTREEWDGERPDLVSAIRLGNGITFGSGEDYYHILSSPQRRQRQNLPLCRVDSHRQHRHPHFQYTPEDALGIDAKC